MTVVDLYTIQIIRAPVAGAPLDSVRVLMEETEENLNDLLQPRGYRARIRRWDDNTDERTNPDAR